MNIDSVTEWVFTNLRLWQTAVGGQCGHARPCSRRTSRSSLLSIPTSAALRGCSLVPPLGHYRRTLWLYIANPSCTCPPVRSRRPGYCLLIPSLKDPLLLPIVWVRRRPSGLVSERPSMLPDDLVWYLPAPLSDSLMSAACCHHPPLTNSQTPFKAYFWDRELPAFRDLFLFQTL